MTGWMDSVREPRADPTAMTAEPDLRRERPERRLRLAPLAPLALAVIAGVVLDRYADPLGTAAWAGLALGLALVACLARRWERTQRIAIVALYLAVGGAYHHARWSDLPHDHLAWSIPDDAPPRPAWVRGTLVRVPEFRPPEFPDEDGYTRTVLDVVGICDGIDWHPASGRVRLSIGGDRTDLVMGEPVQAAGTLGPIEGPRNPGEADFRAVLRGESIRLRLSADDMSVWHDPDGRWQPFRWALGQAREWSRATLTRAIGPDSGPLAAALVLGRREAVDPDINDAFARTGTTHLLAISGLHLQVLAVAVLLACRLVGLGAWRSSGVAALAAIGYAVLVGPMPSVVRSASMTAAICGAVLRSRPARIENLLPLAALVTIASNPSDVFDVGCQLSFLAVAALVWMVPPVQDMLAHGLPRPKLDLRTRTLTWRSPNDPLDALERKLAPRWKKALRGGRDWIGWMLVASAVVWVATAPLVALRFHLVSPIGILLNVPLVPMTSLALILAAVTLGLSAIWAPLGIPTASACAALLTWSEDIVRWGAGVSWGHGFTPGPSTGWVVGYVGLLSGLAYLVLVGRPWRGRASIAVALGAWVVGGFLLPRLAWDTSGPEVEVLAVDHGLAVIIHDGCSGKVRLYDCGRLRDPKIGRRVIAPALWSRGLGHIDEVVLSHADSDHYNALPDLLDRLRIGAIRLPPDFGGPEKPAAAAVLDLARSRGVPVRTIAAGEPWGEPPASPGRAAAVDTLAIAVEHPPRDWLTGAPDNDRSLVLSLAHRDRRLLLTGDLDGAGLAEVLARPAPAGLDAMLAPHHGGRAANPPWLYDWARPGLVVVSQKPPTLPGQDALRWLDERRVPVLRTWQQGAIRLRWTDEGIVASGFLGGRWGDGADPAEPAAQLVRSGMIPPVPALPRPGRINPALGWLVAAVGFSLGALLFVAVLVIEWGAWTLVRPGRRRPGADGAGREPVPSTPWETISVVAADGVRLEGMFRATAQDTPRRRTAILLHGFAEEGTALLDRAEALAERGWDVVLPDIRGRGRSAGDWSTFGALEGDDVRRWIDALATRSAASLDVAVWGRSMGAAIALRAAAADPRIRALVLEVPYADLARSVAIGFRLKRLPAWLARPALRRAGWLAGAHLDRPRPVDLAPQVGVPVLVLHGAEDRLAPISEVHRLATAFPTPPARVEVPGARHSDLFDLAGPELNDRVATFLETATAAET